MVTNRSLSLLWTDSKQRFPFTFSFFPPCNSVVKIQCVLFIVLFLSCAPKPSEPKVPPVSSSPSVSSVPAESRVFTDALGRRYAQKENPSRIVSLSPAVTEILFAIGAGDSVAGVTDYCDFPPEARERVSVGGFSGATVSVEQIRVINPDLVILSADMHARIVFLLDELGIPSFAVEPRNFSQVYDLVSLLGEICGCAAGAEGVIAEMKGKIVGLEERLRGRGRPAVFWLLGEDPLMSVGAGTFVTEAIGLAGGRNIFADVQEQWPLVSPEQVLLRKPDWILFADAMAYDRLGREAGPRLLKTSFWQTLPAVREGRVTFFDGDLLYRYGPRLADAVVMIAQILHAGL